MLRVPDGARAKSRPVRYRACRWPCRDRFLASFSRCCTAHGGAGDHAADRSRFRLAPRLRAVMGHPELSLHRAVAASGAVGRAVADAGRGAGAAVAAQARRGADDRELRRPDGDRSRHHGVPVHDFSEFALVGDPGWPCHHSPDVCAVVARSVPHSPAAGGCRHAGMSCRLSGQANVWPDEAWRGYYDDGYLSKFTRSGVTAVSDFVNYGFMESEAVLAERLKMPLEDSCKSPAAARTSS